MFAQLSRQFFTYAIPAQTAIQFNYIPQKGFKSSQSQIDWIKKPGSITNKLIKNSVNNFSISLFNKDFSINNQNVLWPGSQDHLFPVLKELMDYQQTDKGESIQFFIKPEGAHFYGNCTIKRNAPELFDFIREFTKNEKFIAFQNEVYGLFPGGAEDIDNDTEEGLQSTISSLNQNPGQLKLLPTKLLGGFDRVMLSEPIFIKHEDCETIIWKATTVKGKHIFDGSVEMVFTTYESKGEKNVLMIEIGYGTSRISWKEKANTYLALQLWPHINNKLYLKSMNKLPITECYMPVTKHSISPVINIVDNTANIPKPDDTDDTNEIQKLQLKVVMMDVILQSINSSRVFIDPIDRE
jgi:hypothetical protein